MTPHDTNIITIETAAEATGSGALLGCAAALIASLGLSALLQSFPLPAGVAGVVGAGSLWKVALLAALGAVAAYGAHRLVRAHPRIAARAAGATLQWSALLAVEVACGLGALLAGVGPWLAVLAMLAGGTAAFAAMHRPAAALVRALLALLAPAGPTGPAMLVATYAPQGDGFRLVDLQPRPSGPTADGALYCGVALYPDPSCEGWAASTYRPGGGALSLRLHGCASYVDALARLCSELEQDAAG